MFMRVHFGRLLGPKNAVGQTSERGVYAASASDLPRRPNSKGTHHLVTTLKQRETPRSDACTGHHTTRLHRSRLVLATFASGAALGANVVKAFGIAPWKGDEATPHLLATPNTRSVPHLVVGKAFT